MTSLAPVVLFVYKRPEHTLKTLQALRSSPLAVDTDLIVFSDGPRNEESVASVEAVRRILRDITGFRTVTLRPREDNWGLSRSLIAGVEEVLASRGHAVVLEDDIVVSKHFLGFMNEGLSIYEHNEQVASIHGYCYPVHERLPRTYFLRGADCWGWATWSRAWKFFNPSSAQLLSELRRRRLARKFDFDGAFPYTRMLQAESQGRVDSWAIRWYASAFLAGMYTLYPGQSLVQNIGTDGSGEHSGSGSAYAVELAGDEVPVVAQEVVESAIAHRAFARFLRNQRPPMVSRIRSRIGRSISRGPQ